MRGSTLGSEYDWNFTTTPQEALNGREIDTNRGYVLGGSSAINFLCYDRAAAAEYDAWEDLGNEGWNWDVMIDAMVKSENFTGWDHNLHGYSGPIRSIYNRFVPGYLRTWIPTMNELGIPTNKKSLSGDPIGVMYQTTNIDITGYTRSYSASGYAPLACPNLEIMTETTVTKINFAEEGCCEDLVATGVTLADGTKIQARKEVILSAGTIGTPGLLELSGIGQAEVLEAAGIEQILDLPGVGENYQDHIRTSNSYFLKDGLESADPIIYDPQGKFAEEQRDRWLNGEPSWLDYTTSTYSFLTWELIVGKDGAAKLTDAAERAHGENATIVDKKKVEFLSNPTIPGMELIFEANYVGAAPNPRGNLVTIFTSVMHPMSRGSVHINSTDPTGNPIIDPKYLSNEYDLQASIIGARFARQIANTEPLSSIWDSEYQPGDNVHSDEQWEEFVRNNLLSFWHPTGTAAMLPREDGGVVDSNLVVYGTSNLRVVDCSIMPTILSAHHQTAAYGIAEVMAEMIIMEQKWQK